MELCAGVVIGFGIAILIGIRSSIKRKQKYFEELDVPKFPPKKEE